MYESILNQNHLSIKKDYSITWKLIGSEKLIDFKYKIKNNTTIKCPVRHEGTHYMIENNILISDIYEFDQYKICCDLYKLDFGLLLYHVHKNNLHEYIEFPEKSLKLIWGDIIFGYYDNHILHDNTNKFISPDIFDDMTKSMRNLPHNKNSIYLVLYDSIVYISKLDKYKEALSHLIDFNGLFNYYDNMINRSLIKRV